VHTLAMLVATGSVAVLVYEWVGVAFLRRGWINVDLLWTSALIATGGLLLATGLMAALPLHRPLAALGVAAGGLVASGRSAPGHSQLAYFFRGSSAGLAYVIVHGPTP
jgi:hypothetical protein